MAFRSCTSFVSLIVLGLLAPPVYASRQENALHSTLATYVEAAKQTATNDMSAGLNLMLKADGEVLPEGLTYSFNPSAKSGRPVTVNDESITPGLYELAVQENGRETFRRPFLAIGGLRSDLELRFAGSAGFSLRQTLDIAPLKFVPNKKLLAKPSFSTLKNVMGILDRYSEIELLLIEVHTDPAGDEIQNQELTESRAIEIRNYLVKNGIDAQRIRAIGLGSARPLVTGTDKASRMLNRRVEFVVQELSAEPRLIGGR